jgi:hypothetical protein
MDLLGERIGREGVRHGFPVRPRGGVLVLMLLVVVACTDKPTSDAPWAVLRKAAYHTLDSSSFRVAYTMTGAGQTSGGVWSYAAPDRLRVGPEANPALVQIGSTVYQAATNRRDVYWKETRPFDPDIAFAFLAELHQAENVSGEGEVFTYEIPGESEVAGEVHIHDGLITFVSRQGTVLGRSLREEYRLSGFGEPVSIQAPPDAAVIDGQPSGLPPCAPDGSVPLGQGACVP